MCIFCFSPAVTIYFSRKEVICRDRQQLHIKKDVYKRQVLLGLFGNTFPMNGNWYPDKYENTPDFRRDMAIPEIIKWAVFSLAALLGFSGIPYLRSVSQIICYYLIFIIIPLYPFEALGAGRIYRFSRLLLSLIHI